MKKVNFTEITDLYTLSWVLDQSISLLTHSSLQFRLADLSVVLGLNPSVLTRTRLVHCRPGYKPLVNKRLLYKVLKFLFEQFPTLVIRQNRYGQIQVRLFKTHAGAKLTAFKPDALSQVNFRRSAPKPGSTRWFLEQLEREQAA